MKTIVLCPVCGYLNSPESSRCVECRGTLLGAKAVSQEEAQDLIRLRRVAGNRRRLVRWGLAALLAVIVIGWIAYVNLDPFSSLPPPASNISADPAPGDWPMYRRDPAHTAFVADEGTLPTGELKRRYMSDAPVSASPVVVDGRVYLSTGDRRVVALDSESGEPVWEREVTGPVDSTVAVAGALVFVGLRDGRVLALHRDSGEIEWEFLTQGPIHRSPAVHDGALYIGSDDFRFYALDAMTGERRWSYTTGGRISSSAAVHDDVVAFTSEDKYLYILDKETGSPRLDFRMTTGSRSPVFDGTRVFAIDGLGRLSAIDWRERDVPFEKFTTWAGIQLFTWGLLDSIPDQRGFVWSFLPPGDKLAGIPAVAWGNVYASAASGALYALAASTGQIVWEFHADAEINASPSVLHQTVFVGDAGGTLYAIDALTGEKRWELDIGGAILSTPVIADGTVYVASGDGGLHGIE